MKEQGAVGEEEKDVIMEPFYAVINEKSTLEDYWDLFLRMRYIQESLILEKGD